MRRLLLCAFAVSVCACEAGGVPEVSEELALQPQTQLRGLTLEQEGKRIIFLGRRADLAAQLQDSLAGKELEERWYRFELPVSMTPGPKEEVNFDLSATAGLRFVFRFPAPHPNTKKDYYQTLDVTSASGKLTGTLRLSGSEVAKEAQAITDVGTYLGVSTDCVITHDIVFPDVVLENSRGSFGVGAITEHIP